MKNLVLAAIALGIVTGELAFAKGDTAVIPSGVTKVSRVTGKTRPGETIPNPNQTDTRFGVWGTDLGIMWDDGAGQCLIAFGDTYGAGWGGFGGGPPTGDWRSNVLAISRDRNPQDGLLFDTMVMDRPAHAKELLASRKISGDEETVIPTAGLSVGRRQILHYMSVTSWPPNRPWITNHAGLAYSDNGGVSWTKSSVMWPNNADNRNPFQMGALVKQGWWVYLFGTAAGRQGAVYLARVPQAEVLNKAAYRYWDGKDFVSVEVAAQPLVTGPVSELSVAYNRYFQRWMMVYLAPQRDALVLRDAPSLTGPWTGEKILMRGYGFPGLYGGFIHPWFNDKDEFYFMLSEWPLYNVAWMRAGLAAAPAGDSGNLLSDAGFEEQGTSAGLHAPWRLQGHGGCDHNLGFAHKGSNNAFLRHNKSGWNDISQNISVRPGQRYRFTAWVRTSSNHRGGVIGIRRPDGMILRKTAFTHLGTYTPLALDFTPEGYSTEMQVFVGMQVHNDEDTWIQIDDFSLSPR
jgi:hypothetical protein